MSDSVLSIAFNPAGIELDPKKGLSRQLYQALRQRVLDGRLSGGARLPATRDLATALGISRNSVVRAYDQLYAEGFIEGRIGDGTYVALLPEKALPLKKLSTKLSTGFSTGLSPDLSPKQPNLPVITSSKVIHSTALRTIARHALDQPPSGPPRAFRVGVPAFDLFPFEVWSKLQSAFWRKPDLQQLCYGNPAGDERLRGLIAVYLRTSRGLSCTAEQILITCGAQQGISLCAQLLVEPGEEVAVENPGYHAAAQAFAIAGAQVKGVAVDQEGMKCSELMHLNHCRLVYVTPSHQYPTGVTMSLARRLELLDWAERTQGWIIEDDYDGEYRYSGAPLAPLAALDRHSRVIYVGTFGKIAFPALRLGYLVLPKGLIEPFSQRRSLDMRHSEVSTQAVMAEFMATGHFQRHIRRMRRAALSRRNTLMAEWPLGIDGVGPLPAIAAGLHVAIPVSSLEREKVLLAQARQAEVEINGLSRYWLKDSAEPVDNRAGLVLGFAAVPVEAITAALVRLRQAWRD